MFVEHTLLFTGNSIVRFILLINDIVTTSSSLMVIVKEKKTIASRNKVIEHLAEVTKLDSIQTPKLVESYITVVSQ